MDLIDAVIKKDLNKVRQLLEDGINPNQSDDRDNITPLHFAVLQNSIEIAELLIAAGAKPNARTAIDLQSPLELAEELGFNEMIKFLKKIEQK